VLVVSWKTERIYFILFYFLFFLHHFIFLFFILLVFRIFLFCEWGLVSWKGFTGCPLGTSKQEQCADIWWSFMCFYAIPLSIVCIIFYHSIYTAAINNHDLHPWEHAGRRRIYSKRPMVPPATREANARVDQKFHLFFFILTSSFSEFVRK
jgi:magnesium-transporting ATPase (P-type)